MSHLAQSVSMDVACQQSELMGAGLDQHSGSVLCSVWLWCLCSWTRQVVLDPAPTAQGSSLGLCGSLVSCPR